MTYSHLQADCLYTGISSGPNARCRVWEAFTFTFFTFTTCYNFYVHSSIAVVATAVATVALVVESTVNGLSL